MRVPSASRTATYPDQMRVRCVGRSSCRGRGCVYAVARTHARTARTSGGCHSTCHPRIYLVSSSRDAHDGNTGPLEPPFTMKGRKSGAQVRWHRMSFRYAPPSLNEPRWGRRIREDRPRTRAVVRALPCLSIAAAHHPGAVFTSSGPVGISVGRRLGLCIPFALHPRCRGGEREVLERTPTEDCAACRIGAGAAREDPGKVLS